LAAALTRQKNYMTKRSVTIRLGWPKLWTSGKTNTASDQHDPRTKPGIIPALAVRGGSLRQANNKSPLYQHRCIQTGLAFAAGIALLASTSPARADQDEDQTGKRSLRGQQNEGTRKQDAREIAKRGDVATLPEPLKDRIAEMAGRPHTYLPQTVFSD
jgi:hypothetical protein